LRTLAASVICLIAAPVAWGDWLRVDGSQCQILVSWAAADAKASWTGACRDGKADGAGKVITTSGQKLEGTFSAGEPVNAQGHTTYVTDGVDHIIVSWTIKDRLSWISPLPLQPGEKRVDPGRLVGEWQWQSNDGSCRETHRYQADHQVHIVSKDEALDGVFELVNAGGEVFELRKLNVTSNGRPDCLGNVSTFDDIRRIYVRFVGSDEFMSCGGLTQDSCYGRGRRQPVRQ